ncbi:hypothetical protein BH11PAT1_BH11PAT1_1870 [soil metagenome]
MKKQLPTPSETASSKPLQASQFPIISRLITELGQKTVYQKIFWVNFLCGFLVVAISFMGFKNYQIYQELEKVKKAREQVTAEMHYWEKVVQKYPNYRDGYFMLATMNAQLGDVQKAREYNDKVMQLDPDFQEGKKFQKELE